MAWCILMHKERALNGIRMQWPWEQSPRPATARSGRAPMRANSRDHAGVDAFCRFLSCCGRAERVKLQSMMEELNTQPRCTGVALPVPRPSIDRP
ncbi:MAG: hypothetical protein WA418_34065 [Bradyrhizobium sp.]